MREEDGRWMRILLMAAILAIVVGGTVDLILDRPHWLSFHALFESLMIVGALAIAIWFWLGWSRAARSAGALRATLEERSAEWAAWRTRAEAALHGFGQAIQDQFDAWELTPAEQEVALLLLKGHSHKAIARRTGRSEQTARQHATAVYRKSGLSGRAALSAFFLEDLMLPGDRAPLSRPPESGYGEASPAPPGSRAP